MGIRVPSPEEESLRHLVDNYGKSIFANLSGVTDKDLRQNKYDFNYRVFPEDLGTTGSYHDHYMIINISVPQRTNFTNVKNGQQNIQTFRTLTNESSKVDVLRFQIDPQFTNNGQPIINAPQIPRFTRRIAESIAIYMPSTVNFTSRNDYADVSLTELATGGIISTARNVAGVNRGLKGGNGTILDAAGQFLSSAVTTILKGGSAVSAPINPRVEVYFSNTFQREFQFDFLCAPETETEAFALEQIIKTLRFHKAPEMSTGFELTDSFTLPTYGLFWTPPSEFDITFYMKGVENTHIPRINTCVLVQADIDYSPAEVYSTFKNGYPVQTRISLQFREIEVNHRLRILQGF